MNWTEFNREVGREVTEGAEKRGRRINVPYGYYNVVVRELKVTESRKGAPMLVCEMVVLDGTYSGLSIFQRNVVSIDFQLEQAADFLHSFVEGLEHERLPKPTTSRELARQARYVKSLIHNKHEFRIRYFASMSKYPTTHVLGALTAV